MQLVGREHPTEILRSEIDRTLGSHGGLVLVTGEAGIGKTALVAEVVAAAEDLGALVTTGVCWEGEGTPGFWPWTQVLRGLEQRVDAATWNEVCTGVGDDLSLLQRDGFAQRQAVGSRADAGFGLSDALTTALVRLSRHQPVVVVLDDLHWADPGSLKVLEFVARHAWFEQLMVIGTYRDTEVDARDHPLRPLLQPLVAKATTVALTGVTRDAVRLLLARAAGREPADDVVAEVHRRTGGNPFFVDQTARLWQDSGAVDLIPPGVRDAVARRLGLLPGALVDVLSTAALIGQEVPSDVLGEVTGLTAPELDELLNEAAAVRLLLPGKDGVWHFVHDIVRETLGARIDEADARKRHAAISQVLETNPQTAQDCPGVVAHHAWLAVPEVAPEHVVRLLQEAAWHAMRRLALDEASTHLQRAVRLVPDDQPHQRAELCLEWGSTLHSVGDVESARARYREVADLARVIDDPEMLTRAALRLRGAVWLADTTEMTPVVTELIDEAHAKLVGDSEGKSELERERELSLRAIEIARERGDDEALMHALVARYDAIWEPGTAGEREALAVEVGEAAIRLSDRSGALFCSSLRLVALLEQGKRQWHDELTASIAGADLVDSPYWLSFIAWLRTVEALVAGDFPAARAAQAESRRLDDVSYHRSDRPNDFNILQLQLAWTTDLLQGCTRQAKAHIPALRQAGHPYPDLLAAIAAVQHGDLDAARGYYDRVRDTGDRPSRWFAGLWLRFQAELAAATRDPAICERARHDLVPVADQWAVTFMDGPHGPLSLWLATIDAAERRWDDAVDGFTVAAEAARRLGARVWLAEAQARLAEALVARSGTDDGATAAALAAEVDQEARRMDLPLVRGRVRPLLAADGESSLEQANPEPAGRKPSGPDPANKESVFRFEGQVWSLTYAGSTVHLPDAKGLRDLHTLLSRPGSDVAATELAHPEGGMTAQAVQRVGADPVLDERAKAAYRKRLSELDGQIDRATARQDDDKAAALDRERAALIEELRLATGLGGRARPLGSEAERARKAVSERIRDALRRIDRVHPELATHLRSAVTTGSRCSYTPVGSANWRL